MDNRPFFSIITASLNNAGTLETTLKSLRDQNHLSFEHVVVDGKSSDRSVDLLQSYEDQYRLSWVSEMDNGIADALNKGLMMATGRYIMVLQADDRLLSNDSLQMVFTHLNDESIDIHNFSIILDHPLRGPVLRAPLRLRWWNRYKFIFLHQGAFVHRRVFERIGGFRERFSIAMDYDFFYRALNAGCSVRFTGTPVALMGGEGVGSRANTMLKRLEEERLVQKVNERDAFLRMTQSVFWSLYLPYKTRFLPKLQKRRGGGNAGSSSGNRKSHGGRAFYQYT